MDYFRLIGLNRSWKAGGFKSIYATVRINEQNEDWKHFAFDKTVFPDEKLNFLFDLFKNSGENLWHNKNHQVGIEDSVIKKLKLDSTSYRK